MLGVVEYKFNPSTQKAEVGRSLKVSDQLRIQADPVSEKQNKGMSTGISVISIKLLMLKIVLWYLPIVLVVGKLN